MSDNSQIEWTDATWNPLRGCSRVSQGCVHCYAETVAKRFSGPGLPYEGLVDAKGRWNGTVKLVPEKLDEPLRWRRPRKVFVNSMSDLFHESVPDEYIAAVFGVMAAAPQHTFQVLTKRPERMRKWFQWMKSEAIRQHEPNPLNTAVYWAQQHCPGTWSAGKSWPLRNVWLGVSVEDQRTAEERIPLLLQCPASIRWVSAEPLLGPVDLMWLREDELGTAYDALRGTHSSAPDDLGGPRIDWVVVGGESGRGARPMHPDWVRWLRGQCVCAGVPFFFKQWGEWQDIGAAHEIASETGRPKNARIVDLAGSHGFHGFHGFHGATPRYMLRVGKHAAGRELDGCTWSGWPTTSTECAP